MKIQTLLLLAPPVLLAITFHEYAHAFVANMYGDDTAKQSGRLTLNPLRHLDPLGTIMIFLVHFGWAKPVPVNPHRLKNPKKDMLWISAAGPLANMALALVSGILLRLIFSSVGIPDQHSMTGLLTFMVIMSLQINLALAIFNVLPIAPLDGSKILFGLLPSRALRSFHPHRLNYIRTIHRRVHSWPIDLAICGFFQQYLCRNLRQRIMSSFCFVPCAEIICPGADCRLPEQIHNDINLFNGFNSGT